MSDAERTAEVVAYWLEKADQSLASGRDELRAGRLYDRLFHDRQEGDYVEFVEFKAAEVGESLDATEKLVQRLREFIAPAGVTSDS